MPVYVILYVFHLITLFSGNGYCRSEGIVAMYLQKESCAKRVYCTLVHSKTNSDGNKQQGMDVKSYYGSLNFK